MIKASFTLPNGTSIVIDGKVSFELPSETSITLEGTPEDLQNLLDKADSSGGAISSSIQKPAKNGKPPNGAKQDVRSVSSQVAPDILKIVNIAKSCPEAEAIEKKIVE